MCGIVGLYLKDRAFEARLGALFTPMLIEMTVRGPDSAGVAIYRNSASSGSTKITAFHPDEDFGWEGLTGLLRDQLNADFDVHGNSSHAVITTGAVPEDAVEAINNHDPNLQVMSYGNAIEIYKEMGLPRDVAKRFGVEEMSGSHIIGHTRMATESAVTTDRLAPLFHRPRSLPRAQRVAFQPQPPAPTTCTDASTT